MLNILIHANKKIEYNNTMINRYVYVKNGDAVDQVIRVAKNGSIPINSGPDAFIWNLINSIEDKASILVLSRNYRRASFQDKIIRSQVKAHVFDKGKGFLQRLLYNPVVFFQILIRIILFHPSRIICGTNGAMLLASMIASRILSVPLVYSAHVRIDFDGNRWYRRFFAKVDSFCIRHAHAAISHGPYLLDQLKFIVKNKSRLFEFDVGFEDMQNEILNPLESQFSRAIDERDVILFVGRIEEYKGVFDILEACAERLTLNSRLLLAYAGTGPCLERLKKEVAKRKMNKNVILFGMVPHRELGALMKRCLFVVTPTRKEFVEGRCMAVMESLVAGLPVIAPNFGPFPFLIEHGINGMLYQANSIEDLRLKINSLLDDKVLFKKIKSGAKVSGEALLCPQMTFGEAVIKAFSI